MIQSMTGYGKSVVEYNGKKIHAEIKSLNSKALDLSTRIAPIYREKRWKERAKIGSKGVSQLTIYDLFSEFSENLYVPSEYSGRLTHTYCDYEVAGEVVDYQGVKGRYHEKSFIHMEPSEYDLSISDTYELFLDMLLGEEEIYDG